MTSTDTALEIFAEIGLTGTKLGCGEGGCGACTVMLSHFDAAAGKVVHRSANACLCPLYAVEGMQVITVEGEDDYAADPVGDGSDGNPSSVICCEDVQPNSCISINVS